MIISRNWLNEWIDLESIEAKDIAKTLNSIGLEVDSYNEQNIPKGVVVGYVKSKEKHPDADKLNICQVDVGNEILQIVCGAKNVEAGQFVPVALIKTIMPNGLVIKSAKLRGVQSSGMICSSTELGLPKSNDGIMILDNSIGKLELGKELCEYDALNDVIIEVDITANRGDCQSISGIARDLCVALDLNLRDIAEYEDAENLPGIGRVVSIHAEESIKSSFLYRAVSINEEINENLLVKLRLGLIESTKENPLERLLDYATYSTGVLFRAYDHSKLAKDKEKVPFSIKNGKNGESIIYCENIELGVAGIYQNDVARVDKDTKVAIIEASYSDPDMISMVVGKNKNITKQDCLYRASRGSEPLLSYGTDYLFEKFSSLGCLGLYAGAQQHTMKKDLKTIIVSLKDISAMIGQEFHKNVVVKILKKLGFDVIFNQDSETLNIKIPWFRHDITNYHDICEEIVRIVGIDNIVSKPMKFCEDMRINEKYIEYKNILNLRKKAASIGFFESVHYVFDSSEELECLGFEPCDVDIVNPISNELNSLRPTLINHLLASCEKNVKNSKKSVKLFEYGAVFDKKANQNYNLGFAFCGNKKEPTLLNGAKTEEIDFFTFASMVQNVVGKFELKPSKEKCYLSPYEQADIYQNGEKIGYIGRLHTKFQEKRDLYKTYICEIDVKCLKFSKIKANSYSKFPLTSRDLSLIVPNNMEFVQISSCIKELSILELKDFYPIDIYKSKELNENCSISVKFVFQDDLKTLEDEQVSVIMDKILQALNDKLNIGIR